MKRIDEHEQPVTGMSDAQSRPITLETIRAVSNAVTAPKSNAKRR